MLEFLKAAAAIPARGLAPAEPAIVKPAAEDASVGSILELAFSTQDPLARARGARAAVPA